MQLKQQPSSQTALAVLACTKALFMLCCPAVLANAAVARSFSGYFASLIDKVLPFAWYSSMSAACLARP